MGPRATSRGFNRISLQAIATAALLITGIDLSLRRKLRGLLGTALTWGAVGAIVGFGMFLARYRTWPTAAIHWERTLMLFGVWESLAVLWGVASGVAFGLALWAGERRGIQQLSARRITLWGALGGAAFPFLIYGGLMISHGVSNLPLFGTITGISALLGAAWARTSFALARRLPNAGDVSHTLVAVQNVPNIEATQLSRTHTRV